MKLSFSHVDLFVTHLEKMVDFYTRHIGLVVSDREKRPDGSEIAFLTGDPREHHQVVFASGRPADLPYNMIQQISFRAQSLSALREVYNKLLKEPIVELGPVTHGNAISCYFRDPEGNRLEVFIDMPWHVPNHSAFRSKWAGRTRNSCPLSRTACAPRPALSHGRNGAPVSRRNFNMQTGLRRLVRVQAGRASNQAQSFGSGNSSRYC